VLLSSTGLQQTEGARPSQQGCAGLQEPKFEEAIDHFQQAVALDPTLINARLYLATALPSSTFRAPILRTTTALAEQAIDQYKQVLQVDPKNINSIKGIAYLYLQMKKFDLGQGVTTRRRPRSIPTIPSPITRWPSLTGPKPMCLARKSAPNWA
jgi:tetratricopeptide (TPR) repeat protein